MLGWLSRASVRASRRNRSANCGSSPACVASRGPWPDGVSLMVSVLVPSPPQAEAVGERAGQFGDGADLPRRRLEVVLDAAEADHVAVEQGVAGAAVAVARLADRADV